MHVYLRGTIDESVEKRMCIINGSGVVYPEQNSGTEEVGLRIIHHATHAVRNDATRIVILSGDTDVAVLGLYFWQQLQVIGLQEL